LPRASRILVAPRRHCTTFDPRAREISIDPRALTRFTRRSSRG